MRLISALHPTNNQKRVLAKIVASPTPTVAAEQLAGDANIVAARNMLMKMGLITLSNGEATMTDAGKQVATDENIIDDAGELTQTGQELAYTDTDGTADDDQTTASSPTAPAAPAQSQPDPFTLESVSLLRELLS